MKLYLLERIYDDNPYDTYNAFLIRETTQKRARNLANRLDRDDEENSWLDTTKTSCKILKEEGRRGVIISDCRAA